MDEVLDDKRPFYIYRLKTSAFLLNLEMSRKHDIFFRNTPPLLETRHLPRQSTVTTPIQVSIP